MPALEAVEVVLCLPLGRAVEQRVHSRYWGSPASAGCEINIAKVSKSFEQESPIGRTAIGVDVLLPDILLDNLNLSGQLGLVSRNQIALDGRASVFVNANSHLCLTSSSSSIAPNTLMDLHQMRIRLLEVTDDHLKVCRAMADFG